MKIHSLLSHNSKLMHADKQIKHKHPKNMMVPNKNHFLYRPWTKWTRIIFSMDSPLYDHILFIWTSCKMHLTMLAILLSQVFCFHIIINETQKEYCKQLGLFFYPNKIFRIKSRASMSIWFISLINIHVSQWSIPHNIDVTL